MSKKHDLATGRGIIQAVEEQVDHNLEKEGSYKWVEKDGSRVHIPDTDRTLPKPTRENILGMLAKMGILSVILWLIASVILNVSGIF